MAITRTHQRNPRRGNRLAIDLTPLIDVIFQLLVFLMISSQFKNPEALINLPKGEAEASAPIDADDSIISITITATNEIQINGENTTRVDFANAIRELATTRQQPRAEFRGDTDSRFGLFVELLESARQNGIESLSIIKEIVSDKK